MSALWSILSRLVDVGVAGDAVVEVASKSREIHLIDLLQNFLVITYELAHPAGIPSQAFEGIGARAGLRSPSDDSDDITSISGDRVKLVSCRVVYNRAIVNVILDLTLCLGVSALQATRVVSREVDARGVVGVVVHVLNIESEISIVPHFVGYVVRVELDTFAIFAVLRVLLELATMRSKETRALRFLLPVNVRPVEVGCGTTGKLRQLCRQSIGESCSCDCKRQKEFGHFTRLRCVVLVVRQYPKIVLSKESGQ